MNIVFGVREYNDYLLKDSVGTWSFTIFRNALLLAYGTHADTIHNHPSHVVFGPTYMRQPNEAGLAQNSARGIYGMLGSMDWGWKNCPFTW
jgi:hypothetical protein